MNKKRVCIAIDLKSFYASVECAERNLNPLTTNLVVADASLTAKTICLAVSPSLKAYGLSGRSRLYQVVSKVDQINNQRQKQIPGYQFEGSSFDAVELEKNPRLSLNYIIATPRMGLYMEYSTRIYNIYLKYFSQQDIHVYSIDEVFIEATHYLKSYGKSARELTDVIIKDILSQTGITATAGIGTNLYLAKVAMDIEAKHMPADENGVRIAELDEMSYRRQLWDHQPLTDFWRVGRGYQRRLQEVGINTMGDIARCSLGSVKDYYNEDLLYKMFGVNAELLIDHAWGYEPVMISDIKAYRPENNSLSIGQVLHSPYTYEKAMIIVKEMAESLSLQLVEKGLVTRQIGLSIGYDVENLTDQQIADDYRGEIVQDYYGRLVPKSTNGSVMLPTDTSAGSLIIRAAVEIFSKCANRKLLVRRLNIVAINVTAEEKAEKVEHYDQLDLFSQDQPQQQEVDKKQLEKEKKLQQTILKIKQNYGKNAVVKTADLQQGATAIERNKSIGGHKA